MSITEFVDDSVTKKTLKLEVPAETARAVERRIVAALRARASFPGFRKGHAPDRLVRQRFASEIREELLEKLIPESLFEALHERGLQPIVSPEVAEIHFEAGEPLRFRATVQVRPPIELGTYRGLPLPAIDVEPSEDEIMATLKGIAERMAQFVPVEDRNASRGDFAVLDVHGTFPGGDGKAFDHEKVFVELGADGNIDEINDLVPGLARGESVEFDKTFGDDASDDLAGKRVHYKVDLIEIKEKQLPALDDDFATSSGLGDSFAEVREKVVLTVRRRKEEAARGATRRALLDRLRSAHEFELPEGLVDEAVERALNRIAHDVAHEGVDPSKAGIDWKKLGEEARPGARQRVAEELLLDAIAERESIEASETEVDAAIRDMARATGKDARELKADLVSGGGIEALKSDIRRQKTLAALVEWGVKPDGPGA